jgi:hypothetical protein
VIDALAKKLQPLLSAELPKGWRESAPWGYPQQSELALIAGVFGAQIPENVTSAVAAEYMMRRPGKMLNDLGELAALSEDELGALLGSQWGGSQVLGVPRTRAAVIHDAASILGASGIVSAQNYRDAMKVRGDSVERMLREIRGVGVVTAESISVMMQADHRPDPEVVAFVVGLLGREALVLRHDDVLELLVTTARRLSVEPRVLAHALWLHVSARSGTELV